MFSKATRKGFTEQRKLFSEGFFFSSDFDSALRNQQYSSDYTIVTVLSVEMFSGEIQHAE